jgi:hypothetical protein
MKENIGGINTMEKDEQRSIRFSLNKANRTSKGRESLKPCAWCFFKTIERFEKSTNMSRVLRVNEHEGLLAVENFIKMVLKECAFDIKLVNRQILGQ